MREASALLDAAWAAGVFSGAVLRVDDLRADVLFEAAVGTSSRTPPGGPVQLGSRFDLASLTKLVTATATLRLVDAGALTLGEDVGSILGSDRHAGITVRHLLEHSSGLPAWSALWTSGPVLAAALAVERESPPGQTHRYSDIGFLVLMHALQTVTGRPLQVLNQELVLDPCRMSQTAYRGTGQGVDPAVLASGTIVATERCPERGLLVGEASDRNTWHLGGVAPHAGLFGPAVDLARLARGVWDAPASGLLSEALWELIWAPPALAGGHVLGWDTVAPDGYTSAGRRLSPASRGHLGFSGCSLWIDPERQISIALLTNRIHPTRDDTRIRALRPALHDAVASAVDGMR